METTQTGIKLPNDLLKKVKYIAWHDRQTITGEVIEALTSLVTAWEKANKPITPKMIEDAKIK